jgi:hypothetical protein
MGNLMKQFINRIFGLTKLQEEKEELQIARDKAVAETALAQQAEELAKMSPKERATARGEPWVAVLETHINTENLKNGFFEIDWNDEFVLQLIQAGYGFEGDPAEEVVDRWFRELCKNVASEEGVDMTDRGAGFINVKKIAEGKSEVS